MSYFLAGGMAVASVAASMEANKQAQSNAAASANLLLTNFKKKSNDLKFAGEEVNRQIGMELTKAEFQAQANKATYIAKSSSNEFTAGKVKTQQLRSVDMSAELRKDSIQAAGESKMQDVLVNMDNSLAEYKSGIVNNEINLRNNTKSDLAIGMDAVGAFSSGYTLGSKMFPTDTVKD